MKLGVKSFFLIAAIIALESISVRAQVTQPVAPAQPTQIVPIIQQGLDSVDKIILDLTGLGVVALGVLAWFRGKAQEAAKKASDAHETKLANVANDLVAFSNKATAAVNGMAAELGGVKRAVDDHGAVFKQLAQRGVDAVQQVEAAAPGILEAAKGLQAANDSGTIRLPTFPKPPTTPGPKTAAMVGLALALSLIGILAGGSLTGCVPNGTGSTTQPVVLTPQQQAAQDLAGFENGYALILTGLNVAEASGVISQAEFESTAPYRQAVTAALNAADTAVANGSSTEQASIQIVGAAIASLEAHPVAVKAQATSKPKPTTKAS